MDWTAGHPSPAGSSPSSATSWHCRRQQTHTGHFPKPLTERSSIHFSTLPCENLTSHGSDAVHGIVDQRRVLPLTLGASANQYMERGPADRMICLRCNVEQVKDRGKQIANGPRRRLNATSGYRET
jgi:hypothetical protein